MPELPEVETIKRQLLRKIKGKRIQSVDIRLAKFIKHPLERFRKIVEAAKIESVERRAKLIIIKLSSNYSLIIHLKLTGQLIYNGKPDKHTHLIYNFSDQSRLVHNDLRQFGYIKVIPTKALSDFFKKEKFGPEPLDKKFTIGLFKEMLAKRKNAKIKPLLMDQTFLAGIGNLYSDEILFYAKVRPLRKINTLKLKEIKKIYQGIKKILPLAISRRGSSIDTYIDAEGQRGNYPSLLKVYGREDQTCFFCSNKIKRLKIGGRSAHYCPRCQK